MNSLIPIEEAIYYLEETLRESSQLRRCYTPKATIFQNWLIGVNNALTIIFGANSLQNTSFCGLDFGEKDEDESACSPPPALRTGMSMRITARQVIGKNEDVQWN